MWIAGLKALISSGQGGRSKIDGWNDGLYLEVILPVWGFLVVDFLLCFSPVHNHLAST